MNTSKSNPSIAENKHPARTLPTRSGAVSKLGFFPTYARHSFGFGCKSCALGSSGSVSDTPTKVWNPILIDTFCHLDGDSSLQTELAL